MKKYSLLLSFLCIIALTGYTQQLARHLTIINSETGGAEKESTPAFVGGTQALSAFISNNIKYPLIARENKTQGEVTVRFMVDEQGMVKNAMVPKGKGIGDGCDEEAIRVISSSPKWSPAQRNGIPVAIWYEIPIVFALNEK